MIPTFTRSATFDDLLLHRIEVEHLALAVTAYRQRNVGHRRVAQQSAAIRFLPRAHAVEEVVHVLVVAFVAEAWNDDLLFAKLRGELLAKGLFGDDLRVIELPVLGSFPFIT